MDDPASAQSYYHSQFVQQGFPTPKCATKTKNTTSNQPSLEDAIGEMHRSGSTAEAFNYITGFIMTQMTAKAGIKKHGKVAVEALFQEFLQLHDKGVFSPQDASTLTKEQKRGALRAISVIKEKRCGRIKGRTVADGSVQRGLYPKEQTSSPTTSTDALMLSVMIDAIERRDVAVADVEGAYLHAKMEDFTLLRVEGESVDIMCKVCSDYIPFVTIENGKRVLYLQLLKALYGCVQSALLWYELFTGTLMDMGFTLNPYDPCVANKTINGKQCTIVWYVDDNKISHVEYDVVTRIIKRIEKSFGKMAVTRGKEHEFLGMNITYLENGTAKIRMKGHLEEAIEEFGEAITKSATSPAKRDLFDIDEKSEGLERGVSEAFHSVTAKLLFVSHRARLDVQLPIGFLCTRVTCSTEQDRLKLKRVLEFLKGTLEDYRIVGADDVTIMQTWVDASHAVHKDMKSHTGGVVSFGRGAVMSKSSKQKLNTKSSTESELDGASDYLAYPTWAKKFLASQGYVLKQNIFHQDNKSTIKFEENGRKSCGPNSRHIDIRYFWIKDRLGLEDFEVRYCPTEQMLADFFTKPLQGGLFKKLRAVVMGHMHIDSLRAETPPPTQERVGEQGKDQKKTVRIKVSAGNVSEGADDVPGAKTDAKTQQPFTLIGKKGKPIVRTTNCRKRERRLNSSHSIRIIPS
jgi:KUP system potassium uptake protein